MQEERVRADVAPVRSAQHEGGIRGLFFLDDLISGDERYAGHETSLGGDAGARSLGNKAEIIAPFLDRGAWGVQVPHVNTADEARAAVDAVKYGPEGHRGIFSGGRPAGYGFKGAAADYAREANRQTLVCLMLEEVEAIENLPGLVTVPGVDVYFIGSGDLSQSMGLTGQQTHPDVP